MPSERAVLNRYGLRHLSSIKAVSALTLRLSYPCQLPLLPLARVRHLASLDRLPRSNPESTLLSSDGKLPLPLASLALNGRKGRMTGSVLAWGGKELVVFDLAEDEEDEEDDEMDE